MKSQQLTFSNRDGNNLSARIDLPESGRAKALVLFAHCFTCGKDFNALSNISTTLADAGFGVLRFDFTGLGESEGDFEQTNFSSNVSDLVDAADYLQENYEAPQVLVGHSLGGAAVLQAARQIPSSHAVVTIGAPSSPEQVKKLLSDKKNRIEREGEAEVVLAGRSFTITRQFLDDLEDQTMNKHIRGLDRALLVMHAPFDTVVGIDNAAHIFKTAMHPKSFISLDTADHLLTDKTDSLYAGSVIASWVDRYLQASEKAEDSSPAQEESDVVTVTGEAGYTTVVHAGDHLLYADEPASVGGADKGPSPYQYLAAGLGACTGMTLRMYADRKKWPLEEITVRLNHHKIHADDCTDCEQGNKRIDVIKRVIALQGPLDQSQRARLMEIADKCPVHRTLNSDIRIQTEGEE